jgi:hypothetical protein
VRQCDFQQADGLPVSFASMIASTADEHECEGTDELGDEVAPESRIAAPVSLEDFFQREINSPAQDKRGVDSTETE